MDYKQHLIIAQRLSRLAHEQISTAVNSKADHGRLHAATAMLIDAAGHAHKAERLWRVGEKVHV